MKILKIVKFSNKFGYHFTEIEFLQNFNRGDLIRRFKVLGSFADEHLLEEYLQKVEKNSLQFTNLEEFNITFAQDIIDDFNKRFHGNLSENNFHRLEKILVKECIK